MSLGLTGDGIILRLADRVILGPLSVAVAPGHVVTLMGPSGCGKSSLLAYVCGILDPAFTAAGRVLLNGREITALPVEERRVGILFQDDLLFPHMSVGDNLAFGLTAAVKGRAARLQTIDEALREAELGGFGDRDPATLSGGERARVALMRVLLSAPEVLLLDEPFGRLDLNLRGQIRAFVFDHARRRKLPILLVTHDPEDAAAAGGPVIKLKG